MLNYTQHKSHLEVEQAGRQQQERVVELRQLVVLGLHTHTEKLHTHSCAHYTITITGSCACHTIFIVFVVTPPCLSVCVCVCCFNLSDWLWVHKTATGLTSQPASQSAKLFFPSGLSFQCQCNVIKRLKGIKDTN